MKREESLYSIKRTLPEPWKRKTCLGQSSERTLQTEHYYGFVSDELSKFAERVTDGMFRFLENVASENQPQSEQVR